MATGKTTTYDLTTGIMLDIEDMIHMISPFDTPLLGMFGADGRSALGQGTCFEKKVEWLDETLLTQRSTLSGGAITTGTTTIIVGAADQVKFSTGDILLIDDEYVRVTAYVSTDSLTITRAFGSSTAVNHASGATVLATGTALPEGSDPENARYIDRSNRFNYTQIFGPWAVQTSGSDNVVRKYGLSGTTEFEKQVANRTKEMAVTLEQALLYGVRAEDTGNKWRTMGGMAYWITTNVDAASTAWTEALLLSALETCFNAGGNPDRATMGTKQKRISSSFTSSGSVQVMRPDRERGTVVDYFDSDFGRCSLLMNRWVRVSDVFLYEREQTEVDTLRPLVFEPLAKTGDSVKGQLVGEKTFKFRAQSHAYRFKALT